MFKRIIATLGIGGAVVAVSVAAAATLQINNEPTTAQAATVLPVECDADGVEVFIQNELTTMTTNGVRISGIDDACDGKDVFVQLRAQGGALLASGSLTIPVSVATQVTVNTSPDVPIADFYELRIVID